jgi:hypothetical protein
MAAFWLQKVSKLKSKYINRQDILFVVARHRAEYEYALKTVKAS